MSELHEVQQSTHSTLSQLQNENKEQAREIDNLIDRVKKAEQDQVSLISSYDKEKVLLKTDCTSCNWNFNLLFTTLKRSAEVKFKTFLSEMEQQHNSQLESMSSKRDHEYKDWQNETSLKIAKMQEDLNKKETENQHSLAIRTTTFQLCFKLGQKFAYDKK